MFDDTLFSAHRLLHEKAGQEIHVGYATYFRGDHKINGQPQGFGRVPLSDKRAL